uniref:Pentatricopeptide repeat-containing protein At1g20230 n=1 Tax=Rhizophora mucronata TaxID=61149 RepID=A0A2P2J994_RHIMU
MDKHKMARQGFRKLERLVSSAALSLSQTQQAHAHLFKTGTSTHTHLASRLLSLYANHQFFTDANIVLNSAHHPTTLSFFSILIHASAKLNHFVQAINAFSRMLSQSIMPDARILPSVLKACAALSSLKLGKQIHCIVLVSGFDSDSCVLSSLVHTYIKCDRLSDARNVFDRMAQPDVVACSALLAGYSRNGCVEETKDLFNKMDNLGLGLNLVSWNGMIAGFNQSGHYSEAVIMFQKMHLRGLVPDGVGISCVLPAVGDLEMLSMGIQVHGFVLKQGLGQDNCVASALISMYGKCRCTLEMSKVFDEMYDADIGACNALVTGLSRNGLVDDALELFRELKRQLMDLNVVSWTSMIASCSQNGRDMEALELFREMQVEGVKPNSVTIPCLLPACGNIAALMHGKAVHCFSLKRGISTDFHVGSALIDMYAKCGRLQVSRLCFEIMPSRNLVCWNALMRGYAMHGKAKEVIDVFELMKRSLAKPDFITFTCILSACSQGGLIEEGWHYFNCMSRDHGIEARMEHYACMVTLLGRAGKLDEAYTMIKKMPFEPDVCVWGALLSSCRIHKNVNLGEVVANKLFELEPKNPGNFILLSNIYASKGMWVEVDMVRDMMKSRGLKKNPGCSWIEVKNKVHMLLCGDKSHPQMAQIGEKLTKLIREMKISGYIPRTDFVLQDVEEQDKEHILCGHSEKLAVVLGLLNTSAGTSLRVIKNLRICGDCHAVIKFISRIEQREIFVRDTNRFHHFKGGVCSCGDFW